MPARKISVLQLICPVGFYGAERWVVALGNNVSSEEVSCHLAVTEEGDNQDLSIADVYPSDSFKVFKVPMAGKFDPSAIKNLIKIIKENDISIVHTHGYKSDILGVLAAWFSGIKCISTPHGFGVPTDTKLKVFIGLGKFSLKYMDAVVPLSRQLESEVIACGVKRHKISYIQNGVDLTEVDGFIVDHALKINREIKTIGFVGQMIPRKGIRHLLEIFNRLWLEDNNVQLKLLGDGEERASLESYAETLPSKSAIHFLGFRSDRLDVMSSFDLFAMTSSDEGIPRCLMEAMAMQLPVAAFDIPGIDQLVTHQKSGLLAKYGDLDQLESYWKDLLFKPQLAKALAESARQYVLDNFSGKRMAGEYLSLYQKVLMRN